MKVEPVAKTESGGLRLSLRSETRFAAVGLIVVGVFLISMWAAAWWAMCAQRDALDQARADQMQVTGASLARCAEVMLAAGEVTALRRIVAQTAQDAHLERCRIVLPGGRIVADANPANITLRELPAQWPGGAAVLPTEGPPVPLIFTLVVPQRGSAVLEMARTEDLLQTSYWLTQAGIGGICVTALLALLVLYRRVRAGLRGICAVREALLAREHGQTTIEALEVNPEWGPEARAWNDMLSQEETRQKHVALEKTRETLQARVCGTDRLTVACDALSQGLILLEKNLRATYVNSAAALLLQAKREDMLSADIASFVKDERVVAAARAAAGNGAMQRRTIVEVQRDGETGGGVLRFIVRPVRRDDTGVAMIVVEDITQQRAAEEARHTFVAQATHELRTPLTNIRLYTEMALDEGQKDPAVLANCLNIINQETFRLDRTVADVLSIAEIEAGTMTLRRDDVRLEEIFPELQADYEAQAHGKQVELEFRLPPKLPVLKGDREKIRSALHNLVGNALKYTPAGGQVRVAVKVDPGGQLVVDVSDTGIGMTEEDRQHLFEKFYRAKDPRVAKVTGSGLGLAIAREVIRLHGGDIGVESELNRGSTFTLTLPVPPEGA